MFHFWGLSYIGIDTFSFGRLIFLGVCRGAVLHSGKYGSTNKPRYTVRFEILTMLVIQIFQDNVPRHWEIIIAILESHATFIFRV